jgi:glycosyltransferase involved in cell wall biosynthesis
VRICIATSTFPADPKDTLASPFLLDTIGVLRRAGHEVTVLTQARRDSHETPLPGLEVIWFPWRRLQGRLAETDFSSPSTVLAAASLVYNGTRQVARLRRASAVDVFLCCWVIPSGLYLYLDKLFSRSRVPYVLWALGSDVNKYSDNSLARAVLRRIARGAAQLYADGHKLCDDFGRLAGRPCEFLPTFRAFPAMNGGGGGVSQPPTFLYVGRHSTVKGADCLIDGLVELKEKGDPPYRFVIAGAGELTGALRAKVERHGLTGKVQFAGRVSDEDLRGLYQRADCVVIPSRSESIPLVLSEALQCGKPMIVTDVGDMGMLVSRHRLGRVVPKEDPCALASALGEFIAAPFALDRSGRDALLSELMFENAAPKLIRRLQEAVQR